MPRPFREIPPENEGESERKAEPGNGEGALMTSFGLLDPVMPEAGDVPEMPNHVAQ